jgi:hypothetical protein
MNPNHIQYFVYCKSAVGEYKYSSSKNMEPSNAPPEIELLLSPEGFNDFD